MTDLVKQLRDSKGWPTLGNAAADRIEELEAKLAKAKLLMERIVRGDFTIMTPPDYVTDPPPSAQDLARAAIAELKE